MRTSAPNLSRLLRRSEFQAAAGNGRRFRSSELAVQVLDREDDGLSIRVGLTASRKTGNAVKRNRIRRRLRAAAREAFAGEPRSADVVAIANPATLSAPFDLLVQTLRMALTKARPQRKQQTATSGLASCAEITAPAKGKPARPGSRQVEMKRS